MIRLLRYLTDAVLAESIAGDLDAERRRRAAGAPMAARLWWWRASAGLVVTLATVRCAAFLRGGLRWRPMDELRHDVVHGLRLMRRQPLVTTAAVVTIALGIAVNVLMVTIVKAVLLTLPFQDVDRLVRIEWTAGGRQPPPITLGQFEAWRARPSGFASLAGDWSYGAVLTGADGADALTVETVSAGMFRLLGASPLYGRAFLDEEDRPGARAVMMLSHQFWVRRLGADPGVVGRTLTIDDREVTVIGVMAAGFAGPLARGHVDVWVPLEPYAAVERSRGQVEPTVVLFGKLAPGVRPDRVVAELEAATPPAFVGSGRVAQRVRLASTPLAEEITGDVRGPLLLLSGAAGLVLLIACANVAGLLLGRTDARRRELAIRMACGSTRLRLVRQLITESVVFGLVGGAMGALLAAWGLGGLVALIPGWVPRVAEIHIDWAVLAMCLAASIGSGVLFGLLPAIQASRPPPGAWLGGRADVQSRSRRRWRSALIVLEVALSLALLVGAGLLTQAFLHLRPTHPGFEPDGKIVVTIALPRTRYSTDDRQRLFYDDLTRRLSAQPGIPGISAASFLPLSGMASTSTVSLVGSNSSAVVFAPVVTPNYFAELDIGMLRGRAFTLADVAASTPVALMNETMARRFVPDRDPIGARVQVADDSSQRTVRTIVGVVQDGRMFGDSLRARAELYVPMAQAVGAAQVLILRTARPVGDVSALVRHETGAIDSRLIVDVETVRSMADRQVSAWRFGAWLMSIFALLALALAAVGLFAIVAWSVAERTWEIGVRMALGASPRVVLRGILLRSCSLTLAGVALGLGLALMTTRWLADWLADVSPLDVTTFALTAAVMLAVALVASYVPGRRALSIDPVQALRE